MKGIGWRFPPLRGINEQGYTNSGIETFKGEELIDNLVREICQNSLDAQNPDVNSPVEVRFDLREMKKRDFSVFEEYEKCIAGCKDYWQNDMDDKLRRFISCVDITLGSDEISVLVAGDYNTTGLTGCVDAKNKKTKWKKLTNSDGTSLKDSAGSGGSYGIGKNAPFACSALSTVFYNTFSVDGGRAFVGVARLATLRDENGEDTYGVGHYQYNDEPANVFRPVYENDASDFRDCFVRDEYGTDIIILGFSEEDWINKMKKAAINNFFLAILEKKLIVHVHGETVSADNLDMLIESYPNDKSIQITKQLLSAVRSPDAKEYLSIIEENDAEVSIKTDKNFGRTIANFRETGMLVGKNTRRIFQHYAAVLIIRGESLSSLLRDAEPPRHNRWDHKLIDSKSEPKKRKLAKYATEEIDNSIFELLKRQFEVATEHQIDSDTGEYIADDIDAFGENANGDDILRPKQKIASQKTKPNKTNLTQAAGAPGYGEEKNDEVRNSEKNPRPAPLPRPPRSVEPIASGIDGITSGAGTKTLTIINCRRQKIVPINTEQGLYQMILNDDEPRARIFARIYAVGEDNRRDSLTIDYFIDEGVKTVCNSGRIGPFKLVASETRKIVLRMQSSERMVLNPVIAEE